MDPAPGKQGEAPAQDAPAERRPPFWRLMAYFLRLGALGFGGPVALVGAMHRDLVAARRWVSEDDYRLSLTLAQIMPGPLAAQTAIAIGYFQEGIAGATVGGVAFVLPSFLIVVALSAAYVAYGGLWWMQGLFYGIGAVVIAIIAISAYKLARNTNRRDLLLWGIFAAVLSVTFFTRAELAWLFVLAGLVVLVVRAPPSWLKRRTRLLAAAPFPLVPAVLGALPAGSHPLPQVLGQLFLFFVKAGTFVFGSGLAVVPFLHQGVVQQHRWLTERQFLDAVAVAMITPGPVVITVVFIGYLVAGLPGAAVSALGIFLPVYVLAVAPAAWFRKHRDNPQLKAFVQGATAAATGAIAGAVLILAEKAILDLPTAAITAVSLSVLMLVKIPEPILVAAAGAVGLAVWVLTGRAA